LNLSKPFIERPVATTLLTLGLALGGVLAFQFLGISALPEVDYPTIQVRASLPGASPETMASAVATPLERQFGRIASITEMTSSSQLGSTNITLQFDLSRDINGAARDVQAAINAARGQLPADLPNNPSYFKANPTGAPVLIMALHSQTHDQSQLYDVADSILAQKIAQVPGVGEVHVFGSSKPAVRVQVDPKLIKARSISLDDIASTLNHANAHSAKGLLEGAVRDWQVNSSDQLFRASEYAPLIVAYRNGAPVRLKQLGNVIDSVEDTRNGGADNGQPSILLAVVRQPGANVIEVVDRIKALLPELHAAIPPSVRFDVAQDLTGSIHASVNDVELTLVTSLVLVVLVVFAFLRSVRATVIPALVVPVSLLGTFGVMYLLGYTLNNLSLMALTISTGFVVDDAIVVIENISRYIEAGWRSFEAAVQGAKEIGFTVLSMSISLVAVFIPILLMGGVVGRLFRQFAVTLSVAVTISLIVSLTTTPMMCARMLRPERKTGHGIVYRFFGRALELVQNGYAASLRVVLRHPLPTLIIDLATIALTIYLYVIVPKGFFPQQDTGHIGGTLVADQDISFSAMREKFFNAMKIALSEPSVKDLNGSTGGGTLNVATLWFELHPLGKRHDSTDTVINRLRDKLSNIPGATLYMQPLQDIRIGGRVGNSQYQFTLQSDSIQDLNEWAPKLLAKLKTVPIILDANSDQQVNGLTSALAIDRSAASRLGVSPRQLDTALYSAFGQRQVSTMYRGTNQYHVVMEVLPDFQQRPASLDDIYVPSSNGSAISLSSFTRVKTELNALAVNHQGLFPSVTLTFALAPGVALSDATDAVQNAAQEIGMPGSIHGGFAGTAQVFQASLKSEPWLILAALVTVYIVLGILYESYAHPLIILSTLPSAGVGALLALLVFKVELTVVALIGIILLVGIVKKNAILMIDFALDAERNQKLSTAEAIYQACLTRFRPIIMTTLAALFGGLPLAVGTGTGSEFRSPLGITIVGGLVVSQILTLYTTPVVYIYVAKLQKRFASKPKLDPRLKTLLTDPDGSVSQSLPVRTSPDSALLG
jgi:multidrug efflux pump